MSANKIIEWYFNLPEDRDNSKPTGFPKHLNSKFFGGIQHDEAYICNRHCGCRRRSVVSAIGPCRAKQRLNGRSRQYLRLRLAESSTQ
jgi:hypothetical protein